MFENREKIKLPCTDILLAARSKPQLRSLSRSKPFSYRKETKATDPQTAHVLPLHRPAIPPIGSRLVDQSLSPLGTPGLTARAHDGLA